MLEYIINLTLPKMKRRFLLGFFALVLLVLGLTFTSEDSTGWFLCGYFATLGLVRIVYLFGLNDWMKHRLGFDFSIDNSRWLSNSLRKTL